jgi:5-hydroxyisourate hydrolase-like protein (transthyretin family)
MKKITHLFLFLIFTIPVISTQAQVLKTNLTITILDENGNIQEGATVILYKNEEDYRASKNPAVEKQITDKKGRVKFKDLETMAYFVEVRKGDLNNDGLGAQTGELVSGRTNKVNIIIE